MKDWVLVLAEDKSRRRSPAQNRAQQLSGESIGTRRVDPCGPDQGLPVKAAHAQPLSGSLPSSSAENS